MVPMSWSPDGRFIVYWENTGFEWVLPLDGDRTPFRLMADQSSHSQISPDGNWVAYLAGGNVSVRGFPDGAEAVPVSVDGGLFPALARRRRRALLHERRIARYGHGGDGHRELGLDQGVGVAAVVRYRIPQPQPPEQLPHVCSFARRRAFSDSAARRRHARGSESRRRLADARQRQLELTGSLARRFAHCRDQEPTQRLGSRHGERRSQRDRCARRSAGLRGVARMVARWRARRLSRSGSRRRQRRGLSRECERDRRARAPAHVEGSRRPAPGLHARWQLADLFFFAARR